MYRVFIEGDNYENESDEGVNHTIKSLPEDKEHKSNAEIEGKELVLRAGLDALHKAIGNTHAKGGVPVILREGDFIYSADKDLKIDKAEAKLFELKEPKSKKKALWTPAKMVEKNVDLKDYNRLIAILNDQDSEDISKTSSALMLQKYVNTLGAIAYIQESKKGEEIPEFAKGAAPVYNAELKEEIDAQPQYMKKGGIFQYGGPKPAQAGPYDQLYNIFDPVSQPVTGFAPARQTPQVPVDTNPFSPTYGRPLSQVAPVNSNPVPQPAPIRSQRAAFNPSGYQNNSIYMDRPGEATPTGQSPTYNVGVGVPDLFEEWNGVGVNLNGKTPQKQQEEIYDWAMKNNPDIIRNMWKEFGITNKGKSLGLNTKDLSDEGLKRLKAAYTDNLLGARTIRPQKAPAPDADIQATTPLGIVNPPRAAANVQAPTPAPVAGTATAAPNPEYASNTTLPYNPSIPLSPLQSLNVMYSAAQALTVPKFFPMRPQVSSPLVELERYDPTAQINNVQTAAQQSYNSNSILNPVLAAANNAGTYAQSLQAVNQIQGQYDNQNVGIANQQNMTNANIQRQDMQQNTQLNEQYYNNVQRTRQNYADERRAATNQTVGLFNQYRSGNDALAASLQGQRMYTKPVVDRQGKPVLDANGRPVMQQAPLYDVNNTGWTPQVYYTGAGGLDNLPSQPNTQDLIQQTTNYFLSIGMSPDRAGVAAASVVKSKSALQYSQSQPYQQGGTIKKMRKK